MVFGNFFWNIVVFANFFLLYRSIQNLPMSPSQSYAKNLNLRPL